MPTLNGVGSNRQGLHPAVVFGSGLLLGLVLGVVGPRLLHRDSRDSSESAATTPKPSPKPAPTSILQIAARPDERGLLLTSTLPIQLLKASENGKTKQQDKAVFSGFRNWGGTASYLSNGNGSLLLKTLTGQMISTGWKLADYQKFVRGQELRVPVKAQQPFVLLFQRQGHDAVNLGTFSLGNASAAETASPSGTASAPPAVRPIPPRPNRQPSPQPTAT